MVLCYDAEEESDDEEETEDDIFWGALSVTAQLIEDPKDDCPIWDSDDEKEAEMDFINPFSVEGGGKEQKQTETVLMMINDQ